MARVAADTEGGTHAAVPLTSHRIRPVGRLWPRPPRCPLGGGAVDQLKHDRKENHLMSEHLDAIERVIDETVAPNAMEIDSQATFPRANLDALAKAGALGLASGADVGGAGQGLDAAAAVIERL